MAKATSWVSSPFQVATVQALLEKEGGVWRVIDHGYQFRFLKGEILSWWPRNGTLTFTGQEFSDELRRECLATCRKVDVKQESRLFK